MVKKEKGDIHISLDQELIDKVEKKRGLITRSAYINHLLREVLK